MGLRTIRKYIDAIADTNNKKGNQPWPVILAVPNSQKYEPFGF
ncbi:hypothetical protein HMPREF1205_02806 [Bacteroides fragilis HMW 616]|nr:hypothetical protein HMPREF1205_02806 [Bacteroides fragilis HMW 616]